MRLIGQRNLFMNFIRIRFTITLFREISKIKRRENEYKTYDEDLLKVIGEILTGLVFFTLKENVICRVASF